MRLQILFVGSLTAWAHQLKKQTLIVVCGTTMWAHLLIILLRLNFGCSLSNDVRSSLRSCSQNQRIFFKSKFLPWAAVYSIYSLMEILSLQLFFMWNWYFTLVIIAALCLIIFKEFYLIQLIHFAWYRYQWY